MTTPVAYRFTANAHDRDPPTVNAAFELLECDASSLQALRTHEQFQDATIELRVWREAAKPLPGWQLLDTDQLLHKCLKENPDGLVLLATIGTTRAAARAPEAASGVGSAAGASVAIVPGAAGSSRAPELLIRIDASALQAAMERSHSQDENISEKSYAFSTTNWDEAAEAAERLGWRLDSISDAQVESTRAVVEFTWLADGREDDKVNRLNIVKELNEQLQLPPYIEIMSVERKVMVKYEGGPANKRTKLRGKTDFIAVLKAQSKHLQLCGAGSGLEYVVNVFETKTTKALVDDANKCRGAAAAECLAANLSLQRAPVQLLPEGFPVIMTDMNRFFLYHQKPDEQVIVEISYQNKEAAYDALAKLLRRHAEHVHTRHTRKAAQYQSVMAAAAATAAAGMDAGWASTSGGVAGAGAMEAELQSAEVADAARTIASQLKLQPTNPVGVKVYIEELGCAIARALEQRSAAHSSGSVHSPSSSSQISYAQVPEPFAHLYL